MGDLLYWGLNIFCHFSRLHHEPRHLSRHSALLNLLDSGSSSRWVSAFWHAAHKAVTAWMSTSSKMFPDTRGNRLWDRVAKTRYYPHTPQRVNINTAESHFPPDWKVSLFWLMPVWHEPSNHKRHVKVTSISIPTNAPCTSTKWHPDLPQLIVAALKLRGTAAKPVHVEQVKQVSTASIMDYSSDSITLKPETKIYSEKLLVIQKTEGWMFW